MKLHHRQGSNMFPPCSTRLPAHLARSCKRLQVLKNPKSKKLGIPQTLEIAVRCHVPSTAFPCFFQVFSCEQVSPSWAARPPLNWQDLRWLEKNHNGFGKSKSSTKSHQLVISKRTCLFPEMTIPRYWTKESSSYAINWRSVWLQNQFKHSWSTGLWWSVANIWEQCSSYIRTPNPFQLLQVRMENMKKENMCGLNQKKPRRRIVESGRLHAHPHQVHWRGQVNLSLHATKINVTIARWVCIWLYRNPSDLPLSLKPLCEIWIPKESQDLLQAILLILILPDHTI